MTTVNVYEAKPHLSQLLELVVSGEEVIIARAGKPMDRLKAYQGDKGMRKLGYWRGKVKIEKDFDALPVSFSKAFQGEKT